MGKTYSRKRYTQEFKREVVLMIINGDRSPSEVAGELGINATMLHRWRREYLKDQDEAFPGKGHLKPEEEELRRLRRELENVKIERDILKKALAIFSMTPR